MTNPITPQHIQATKPGGANPPQVSDEDILEQVADGNVPCFEVFMNRHKSPVFRYALHCLGDVQQAEDLAQEAFLRAFRAVRDGGYGQRASPRTWLFAIARNCVIDELRKDRRRPPLVDAALHGGEEDDPPAAGADPAAGIILDEENLKIQQLLEQLPQAQRDVLCLKIYADLTLAQTAQILQCPPATVRSRLRYALEKVHALLEETGRNDHE
jgi:RNA polymerase sigma-70 factor (ECF subfamily)